jgi:hypothetical protein
MLVVNDLGRFYIRKFTINIGKTSCCCVHILMTPKNSRRGIWVPRACVIPLVLLCLIIFVVDSCSRR